jgi:hypothetical protein
MRRGDDASARWWRVGKRSLTAAIVPVQYLAIVALIAAPISAFAQQTERHHQAADDSILVKLMNAQTCARGIHPMPEELYRCDPL